MGLKYDDANQVTGTAPRTHASKLLISFILKETVQAFPMPKSFDQDLISHLGVGLFKKEVPGGAAVPEGLWRNLCSTEKERESKGELKRTDALDSCDYIFPTHHLLRCPVNTWVAARMENTG